MYNIIKEVKNLQAHSSTVLKTKCMAWFWQYCFSISE